jgi:hypothetical protein
MEKQLEKPTVDFSTIENCFKHIEYLEQVKKCETCLSGNTFEIIFRRDDSALLNKISYEGLNKLRSIQEVLTTYYAAENRKTGQTTRLVNEYIDRLFSGDKVIAKDHHDGSNRYIIGIIIKRLINEHNFTKCPNDHYQSNFEEGYYILKINYGTSEMKLSKIYY